MDEFELIQQFFSRSNADSGVVLGIGDDGAVLRASPGCEQVQVIDTLVADVHFPGDTHPADIGFRAVAVNLSDIAAMGAVPRWMTLALTVSEADADWLAAFAEGLFLAAKPFDLALVGGDTTFGPVTTITISVTGEVDKGTAILRSGAAPGDGIFVSGTLGDAAAGLAALQHGKPIADLTGRFLRPTARVELGRELVGKASAAIDVSDGLAGDLAKLLLASSVAGEIDLDKLPISKALQAHRQRPDQLKLALTGGDDYELCVTGPLDVLSSIEGLTRIGQVSLGEGLRCLRDGKIVDVDDSGYRHFQ